MALFFLQPMVIGAWLALIPVVKENLGLTKLELSFALLGMPIAVLVALQVAGALVGRVGVRRVMVLIFPLQGAGALLPLIAGNQAWLFAALLVFGASHAFMEVGLNVYAGRIEKRAARHVMNRCHGFWALGLMSGSALATAGAGVIPGVAAMILIAVLSCGVGILAARALPQVGGEGAGHSPPRRRLNQMPPALAAIGFFMFVVTLAEGAMSDWSAIYLSETQGIDITDAGIAVTIFAGFMAAGRFSGDWLKGRFGALMLARVSVLVAALGLGCLVTPLPLAFTFIGLALVGLGVASGYPLGVSAVAALDDIHEAGNVAIMSTCALTGFLVGPPLIGFLSDAFGIRAGFAALIPGMILAFWLSRWLLTDQNPRNRA